MAPPQAYHWSSPHKDKLESSHWFQGNLEAKPEEIQIPDFELELTEDDLVNLDPVA